MKFEMILATSYNHVIGTDSKPIPWRLQSDLAEFKRKTLGHLLVYGRNTFSTLPWSNGFPERVNLVLTSSTKVRPESGVETFSGLLGVDFIKKCSDLIQDNDCPDTVYIVGGAEVYKQALAQLPITKIHHTLVHAVIDDVTSITVPMFHGFVKSAEETFKADEKNEFDYSYITWEKSCGN